MEIPKPLTIGVAIPTLCSEKHLKHCLPPFLESPLHPKVLVVDSSSDDATVAVAKSLGAETLVIPRAQFNHGRTRDLARKHLGTDIIVMITPDAYAKDNSILESLTKPLMEGLASVAYARQVPHLGADVFESFPRSFNYPATSHIRSLQDIDKYGVYTFFCSNSCAAYLNRALDEIGGFQTVYFGEDTIAAAKLLRKGHKIAYVSEAIVHHSHRYTLKQEFQRNFDTGLSRKEYQHLLNGSDSKRGLSFVLQFCKHLWNEQPTLLPYALLQSGIKWLGYQLGKYSLHAPLWIKKTCSSQRFYWESKYTVK